MNRLYLLPFLFVYGQCFLVEDSLRGQLPESQVYGNPWRNGTSNRQPLILTEFLDNGRIMEGQEAAKVEGILENITSYSGYFTVNHMFNRNLFFWYFPAEENPADSPVLLWLQGGPGMSSMYGLALENGPILLKEDGSISLRPHRWTKNHHVIYVDNPAGVGFSFPAPNAPVNEDEVSNDLYFALVQFFRLFPQIAKNDFYVTGESYGGQYVPSVADLIRRYNPTARVNINLKGLMIGNGMIQNNCLKDNAIGKDFLIQNGLPSSFLGTLINPYNYLQNGNGLDYMGMNSFFNDESVQRKIHVGNVHYTTLNQDVRSEVHEGERGFSVIQIVQELLEHYPILYYYGQLDATCPYPPSEAELYSLRWSCWSCFAQARREHWMVGDNLAGYVKSGGNLMVALVRNAGHMVPIDQPVWALELIKKFLNKQSQR